MPVLYTDSYSKTYLAAQCSKSWCLWVLFSVFVILIPIFAGYATEEFWNRIQIHYEQPIVEFTDNYILFTTENNGEDSKFYSSYTTLNNEFSTGGGLLVSGAGLSVTPIQNSLTKKNEQFDVTLTFFTNQATFRNVKLMLLFDYALNEKAKLLIKSMCVIDIDTSRGVESINMIGDLILKQKSPIGSTSIPSKMYYKNDYFDEAFSPYDYVELYKSFQRRNYTLSYKHETKINSPRIVLPPPVPPTTPNPGEVIINMKINIPKMQKVLYISSVYQSLKETWIQYLFIFIPIFYIVRLLFLFILDNKVFPCSEINDLPQTNKLS